MFVVATAGHVDHGKSTLVRALTGREPDRWAEERRRGMTIDLGFAWTALPSGRTVAFVDVPGHERFVGNMLAGVGAVPAVLFVVAADEGWMPQSAEHLDALHALGVHYGLLAVTRSDRAGPGPARERALAELAGTSLAAGGGVEAVAVSGTTGAGLPELRAALDRLVGRLPAADPAAPVRLWVDRSFTVRGSGTVVTGTLAAGRIRPGDELLIAPGGSAATVRSLQSLGQARTEVTGTARVALNLRGVRPADVRRGAALVTPGGWLETDLIDVRLAPPPAGGLAGSGAAGVAALPREITLHVGAAAVPVRVRPLGMDTVRLRLAHPLPLRIGDRAVLRDPGRRQVAAGVTVLDVRPPPLDRRGAAAARAADLSTMDGIPDGAGELRRRGLLRLRDLRAMGAEPPVAPVAGEWLVDPARWAGWRHRLAELVAEHAASHPLEHGLPVEAARRQLDLPDARLVTALTATPPPPGVPAPDLPPDTGSPTAAGSASGGSVAGAGVAAADRASGGPVGGPLAVRDGRVVPAGGAPALPEPVRAAVGAVRSGLAAAPFAAPEASRLAELGLGGRELAAAVRAGALLRVADGVYLLPGADDAAAAALRALPQPFTLSAARQALRTTRRVAVPLLELLDARGVTERLPDSRRRFAPGRAGE